MNISLQKSFLIVALSLFVNDCIGIGKDIAVHAAKICADSLYGSVGQLIAALKGTENTLKVLGKQGEQMSNVLSDAAKNVGSNSAQALLKTAELTSETAKIFAGSVKRATYVAWAGVAIAASYIGYKMGINVYDRYDKKNKEKVLIAAKQALLDILIKNSGNKAGLFGLPEGCEKEAGALLALDGGNNELAIIRATFKPRTLP